MTENNKKEEGIFIPYQITEDYELSYKVDLKSCLSLLENTQIVQASIMENMESLLYKVMQDFFIKGLKLGNELENLDEENEELINETFKQLIKKHLTFN